MTSDEFLDLKELPASVAVIGGGVDRVRVRLAPGRPRVQGHHPRGARHASCPAATTTSSASWPARSRSGASTSSPASRSRATRRRRTATVTTVRAGEQTLGRRGRRRVGGPAAPHRGAGGRRGRRRRSTSAASSWPTSTSAPASRASGPWATSWPARRSWPTSGSPRPSSRSRACWASRSCRSTTPRCRGPSTATPRWPSAA